MGNSFVNEMLDMPCLLWIALRRPVGSFQKGPQSDN